MNGDENCEIDLNTETRTANVTVIMKRQEDIVIKEDITGKVEVVIGEEKILESFDLQIFNEEKADEELEIYYKEIDGEYKKLESDTITAEGDGSYTIWFKINGIEEDRTVFAKLDGGSKDYVFSYSNGSYKKGIRFTKGGTRKVQICLSDEIVKEITINLTIKNDNKHLVIYGVSQSGVPNVNVTDVEGWDRASVTNYTYNQHDTNGENFFIIDGEGDDTVYYCFKHGDHLPVNEAYSYFILYDAQEYTNLKPQDKLILAFLGEVTTFTDKTGTTIDFTNNEYDKYGVQQFYIWGEVLGTQGINYGKFENMINELKELPNGKNKYIDVNNMTITVNGETKKVSEFEATKYVYREQLDANNEPHENPDGKGTQPLFKYTYELEDGPGIQLKKVDKNGNPIEGVQFRISHKTKEGKWEYDEEYYETNEEGLTEIISLEDGEYFIHEIKAPEGYKPSNQYVILTVKNGEYEYKVYEVNKEKLDEKGYVKNASDGTPISDNTESDWDSEEVEANGPVELQLVLTNRPGTNIQLLKINEDHEPLEATFEIYIEKNGKWIQYKAEGKDDNTYTTDSTYGLTEEIGLEIGRYLIIETKAPHNYTPSSQYVIVEVTEDGKCEYKTHSVDENNLTEEGYVTVNSANGPEVNEDDAEWYSSNDGESSGTVALQLCVINRHMPSIKIQKLDDLGKAITGKGGKFKITLKSASGKVVYDKEKELNANGEIEITFTDEEQIQGKKFSLQVKEIEAPQGYDKLEQDTCNLTISFEKGEWKVINNDTEDGTFHAIVYNSTIGISVKNAKKKDIDFKIQKIDGDSGAPLSNVKFSVKIGSLYSGTLTTDSNGNTNAITIKKENLKAGTYQVNITETNAPSGYKKIDAVTFNIIVDKAGSINVGNSSNPNAEVIINSTEETVSIVVIIKNTKENTNKTTPPEYESFPLIMSISGKVWLDQPSGKNSEANGKYDSTDKLLEGIEVTLYESDGKTPAKFADRDKVLQALKSDTAKKYLTSDIITEISNTAAFIPDTNVTKTDKAGNFSFVGLDPDKSYIVEFKYNGMRYEEITYSIQMAIAGEDGYGINKDTTTTAVAREDSAKREEINKRYSEIKPGDIVFTQTEVEEYLKSNKQTLPQGATKEQMEQFLDNTEITARTPAVGKILTKSEAELTGWNAGVYPQIYGAYKFPVVKTKVDAVIPYTAGEEAVREWIDNFYSEYKQGSKKVGYSITATECYFVKTTIHYGGHSSHSVDGPYYDYHVPYSGLYESYIKEVKRTGSVHVPNQSPGICGTFLYHVDGHYTYDSKGNKNGYVPGFDVHCTGRVGTSVSHSARDDEESYWTCTLYYVDEGYKTGVDEDDKHITRFATFDLGCEPMFDYDQKAGKSGVEDGKWGWIKIHNVDNNKITTPQGNEGIGKLYWMLWSAIKTYSPNNQDLCVVYRPTVDLGLYDDVMKAIVTVSSTQKGTEVTTYKYDKRLANGGTFKFGVNVYNIENSNTGKTIRQVEEEYQAYYSSLSDGKPDHGENAIEQKEYDPLGERKEDVQINTGQDGAITQNGKAISGFNINHDLEIEIIYKIQLYNEAAVTAWVTDIIDYYDQDFSFVGAYTNKDCTESIACEAYNGDDIPDGYKAVNINLNDKVLKGNETYNIYVKVKLGKDTSKETLIRRGLLADDVENAFKTWNYSEINGYRTKIGVVDIDSSPGDLVPEGRFENGPYDDDESKSPTLIFKNPVETRTIKGQVFEDETGINIVTGTERNGTGNRIPIQGAIVKLIEVDESGTPLESGYDTQAGEEIGFRCKTLTKADGSYEFLEITPGNYVVKFEYGSNYSTVIKQNLESGLDYVNLAERGNSYYDYDSVTAVNQHSYNGQDYESILKEYSNPDPYWYLNTTAGEIYAADNAQRRNDVISQSTTLTNEKAEVFNSYKDSKINYTLLNTLIDNYNMYGTTPRMLLRIENYKEHPDEENNSQIVDTNDIGHYEKNYEINNIDFGIVERERAEIQITKKVSYISIEDSAGKEITGGSVGAIQNGDVKYIKMVPNVDSIQGFADLEIDKELLSGATLKITYEITVTNNSETSSRNPNTIQDIIVIDYVSNNLNFDTKYGDNSTYEWETKTTSDITSLINSESISTTDISNKIDLSTYQTILMTTFGKNGGIAPHGHETKTLTLEKNLSPQEESNFNYENQVEIVQSTNGIGRGDYSSIYGNLDPMTYTSRQGHLNWDKIAGKTDKTVKESGADITNENAIRLAEKDSGNAEEVIITPPTGAKGIVLQTYHYVLALIALVTLAGIVVLIKKYVVTPKE